MTSKQAGRLILLFPDDKAAGLPSADRRSGMKPPADAAGLFSAADWRLLLRWARDIAMDGWRPEAVFAQMLSTADSGADFEAMAVNLPDWNAANGGAAGRGAGGLQGKVAGCGLNADLFVCAECGSTFDLAWRLAAPGVLGGQNGLDAWAGVLALRQSSGRGQLRRIWHSPPGNLHFSFRLPETFRNEEAASILTALLLIEAFGCLGLELNLKWPNDLVLRENGLPVKLGGILLEERGETLLAGVGVNCVSAPEPELMRAEAAMRAGTLPVDFHPKTPISLGLELVQKMILMYEKTFQTTSTAQLLRQSEEYLLWKGSEVQVRDFSEDGSVVTGVLSGLTELGGLRLLVSGKNFSSGCSCGPSGSEELALYSGSLKGTD